jgi:ABC-2 type transport system ATP-binding protein
LSKRFGTSRALTEVSLTVQRGEILGLIGPNGSGKTTLLECLAGLLPPDSGQILGNGREITGRVRDLFFVPDGIVPWEAQSVRWVLRFFEALHRSPPGLRESVASELSLFELLHQTIGGLSRGQRKRVLTALGLLTSYPLLLLDEPFEGLDVRQVREAAEMLHAWSARGRTLLLSVHQLVDAERVCDRMVLLDGGRVVGAGTLDELRSQAGLPDGTLEEVFLALT